MSDIAGNGAAILIRESPGFDRQSGPFLQKTWRGTRAAIYATASEIGLSADNWTIDPEGNGVYTLTARFSNNTTEGTAEVPVREERLRFNEVQRPIYSSPAYSSLSREQISEVRRAVEDRRITVFTGNVEEATLMIALFNIAIVIDSYNIYQPTIIVTDTASAGYAWNIGFANYGYTYSTANMIADAALTSGWKANLPADVSTLDGFIYGWLKKPPEIVTVAGNKTQLIQEYVYGLWAEAVLPQA